MRCLQPRAQSTFNTSHSPPNSSSGQALPKARGEGEEPEEGRGRGQDTSTSVPGGASLIKLIQGSLFELRLANVSACYSSCAPAERASLQVTEAATASSPSTQRRSPRPILPYTRISGRPKATPSHQAGLPFSQTILICLLPCSNYTKHSLLAAQQLFTQSKGMCFLLLIHISWSSYVSAAGAGWHGATQLLCMGY